MVGELNIPGGRLLVIYDGHCGLCNCAVRWFLRRDSYDRLRFVAANSPKGAALLARHELDPTLASADSGTIVVVVAPDTHAERLDFRSDAVLALLRQLPLPWPAAGAMLRLIPRPLRDLGYRLIARFRYRIWGRSDTCPIPTAEERARFL